MKALKSASPTIEREPAKRMIRSFIDRVGINDTAACTAYAVYIYNVSELSKEEVLTIFEEEQVIVNFIG